ncbi:MAG: polyhydroxyalkanoate synthesis repressor PhaR, partial [Mesorhizobium sp.]|nr:polyhydroxyalkanoate synthesis repressor PhaR [Mesorhizobium sp.]
TIVPPLKAIEEQTRRNMEMFQNAIRMFVPFPQAAGTGPEPDAEEAPARKTTAKSGDLAELKEQIAAMQKKIDSME